MLDGLAADLAAASPHRTMATPTADLTTTIASARKSESIFGRPDA
jgi:hypothetical protein